MRIHLVAALSLALSGCSGGGISAGGLARLNPLNWFNGSQSAALGPQSLAPRGGYVGLQDSRPLAAQVVSVRLEPTGSGIIVLAVGRTAQTGAAHLALVAETAQNPAQLAFSLRATPPQNASGAGAQDRVAGAYIPQEQLAGIREILVQGAANSVVARR